MKKETKKKNYLAYTENMDSLTIRINANRNYSNFSLHNWFDQNLLWQFGDTVLDLGCGSGNYFSVYSKQLGSNGVIVGLDQSDALLAKAQNRKKETSVVLLNWDINNAFPFFDGSFEHVISTFAIYYVTDTDMILSEIKRVLKPGGKVLLIGPSKNNAKELYDYNEKLFSFKMNDKTIKRTTRLEKEFYPAMSKIFRCVVQDRIPSKLIFPNKKEFLKYYLATLLFEESQKKANTKPIKEEFMYHIPESCEISKEIVVLKGIKKV